MKVILDTNFLIYCAKNKMDYVEEINHLLNEDYELVVPVQVINELKRLKLSTKKGKDKVACDLALQLIDKNNLKQIKPIGINTDQAIINASKKDSKNIVATLDREMRHILGRVILISRGKRLLLTR